MKEKWIVEIELDVEHFNGVQHEQGTPFTRIVNEDYGLIEAFPDGLHFHANLGCFIILPWKLVKREPLQEPTNG